MIGDSLFFPEGGTQGGVLKIMIVAKFIQILLKIIADKTKFNTLIPFKQ